MESQLADGNFLKHRDGILSRRFVEEEEEVCVVSSFEICLKRRKVEKNKTEQKCLQEWRQRGIGKGSESSVPRRGGHSRVRGKFAFPVHDE